MTRHEIRHVVIVRIILHVVRMSRVAISITVYRTVVGVLRMVKIIGRRNVCAVP